MNAPTADMLPQLGERLCLPNKGAEVPNGRFLGGCCSMSAPPSSASISCHSTSLQVLAPVCWMRGWRCRACLMLMTNLHTSVTMWQLTAFKIMGGWLLLAETVKGGPHALANLGDFFLLLSGSQSVGSSLADSAGFSATARQIWPAVAVWLGMRCSTVSTMLLNSSGRGGARAAGGPASGTERQSQEGPNLQ